MRIEVYKKDHKVSVKDFLLGTDGDKFNKTKNFPIHRISDYILSQLQNSGVVFRFSDGSNEIAPGEPGYFFSEQDITDKTQITKLYFSKDSFYGEELEALFVSAGSNLGDLYLGLTQQDDTANYGFFNVGNVIDAGDYFEIDVDLRGQLFAKDFLHDKNYALFFDIASSNEFSISIEAGVFMLYKNGALVDQVDMSQYLDDTNLARLIGGTVDSNGIATFKRDDDSEFTVDFSQFLSGITPTKLSQLENDTNFVPGAQLYNRSEIDNKDAAIQLQVTKLNGLYLQKDTVNNKIYLKNADGTTLSTIDGYQNDGIGYSIEFDTDSRTIYILDSSSEIVDSIPVSILVEDKMDKGGYDGTGQDLKDYIDTLLKGLKWKDSVFCATTGNITLSGEQIIDGQQTNASRVLVKDQTNLTENGIYISSATAWSRAADADAGEELVEATVGVEQGETNKNVKFTCVSTNITLGTTDIEWGFLTKELGVTLDELEEKLLDYTPNGGNTTDTAQTLRDDIDLLRVITGRVSPNEFHYETTWTDSQKVQAALDKSIQEDKNLVIDFNVEHAEGIWLLDEAILIPSNAKIFIDTKIKLSNQCRDNFFRTENAGFGITDTLSNPVENFSIKAFGRQATLEGADIPRATGDARKTLVVEPTEGHFSYGSDALVPEEKQTGDWRNNAIVLVNAHNFEVSGLKFKDVHSRCIQPEICSNYSISDIETDSHTERIIDGSPQLVKNTGGIIVEGPSESFTIDNVRGYNGDDVVALLSLNERTSGIGTYDYSRITGYETLGDIKNFNISNIMSMTEHNLIRLLCNSGYKIRNGNIDNVNDIRESGSNNSVLVVGETSPQYPESVLGSISNLSINDIKGQGGDMVIELLSLADSTISNVFQNKPTGVAIVVGGYGTRNVIVSNIIERE